MGGGRGRATNNRSTWRASFKHTLQAAAALLLGRGELDGVEDAICRASVELILLIISTDAGN